MENKEMAYNLINEDLRKWNLRKRRLEDFLEVLKYSNIDEDIRIEFIKRSCEEKEICEEQELQLKYELEQVLFCPKIVRGLK